MPTNQIPGSAITPPKRGRAGIWQSLDMGKGRGRRPRARDRAAGRGRQDFCERENSGFPEIEMADRTGPSYVGGGGVGGTGDIREYVRSTVYGGGNKYGRAVVGVIQLASASG